MNQTTGNNLMAEDDIYGNRRIYYSLLQTIPYYLKKQKYSTSSTSSTPTLTLIDENTATGVVTNDDEGDEYIIKTIIKTYIDQLASQRCIPKNTESAKYTKRNADKRKYSIKQPLNALYFIKLATQFESQDISYVRRLRYMRNLITLCNFTNKDLKDIQREDFDVIMAQINQNLKSMESRKDFVGSIKSVWRRLFPHLDEQGRIDEHVTPYAVRHLKVNQHRSKQKSRTDKLEWTEFEKLVGYFENDKRIQAYLMLALESLGRPQEILYRRIENVHLYDTYAKIELTEHTKTGLGFLQSIDSFPYLVAWLNTHPQKHNKKAWLFCNIARNKNCEQLTPANINKNLRIACKHLGIDKPITCYSLKRCGVTFRRARGESDTEIQHTARWTSTKQLHTYDLGNQEDALKRSLARRGLIQDEIYADLLPKTKTCRYCNTNNLWHSDICKNCKRLIDDAKIKKAVQTDDFERETMRCAIELLQKQVKRLNKHLTNGKL